MTAIHCANCDFPVSGEMEGKFYQVYGTDSYGNPRKVIFAVCGNCSIRQCLSEIKNPDDFFVDD